MILMPTTQGCSPSLTPPLFHRVVPRDVPLRLTAPGVSPELQRVIALAAAQKFLSLNPHSRGLTFEPDPVGFVRAAWWEAGLDLMGPEIFADENMHGMAILYQSILKRHGLFETRPTPGDLVFLGPIKSKNNPFPTQVALVESVDADGTVHALGRFADGARRITFDTTRKHKTCDDNGKIFNDMLANQKTAGSLFWSYGLPY